MPSDDLYRALLAELAAENAVDCCYECAQMLKAEAALRAVVELHAPDMLVYPTCQAEDYGDHYVRWPCSTIQVIADTLGLTAEQDPKTHREEERRG